MNIEEMLALHANGSYDQQFNNYAGVANALSVLDTNDGVQGTINSNGPCHACVSRDMERPNTIAVITKSNPTLANNQGAVQFFDWLINKSFFSNVFLCKDPVLSLKHGFVKRVDVNGARWLGAAQLSRLATSEFKLQMSAVYDSLASGFEIHPILLVQMATKWNLRSDGKTVHSLGQNYMNKIDMNNQNSTHLPWVNFRTEADLQETCKDDPAKPVNRRYSDEPEHWFKSRIWPSMSNCILRVNDTNGGGISNKLVGMLQGLSSGNPTLLFGVKQEADLAYTCFWEKAVTNLLRTIPNSSDNGEKFSLNLQPLEALSKELNLGA